MAVAEKPSVARIISEVLHANQARKGYYEGNGWRISWCVGHLVENAPPEAYDPRYKKWRWADLPIFPDPWKTRTAEVARKQYDILADLMNQPGVTACVNCCDAGREGEAIFRLVYDQCGCTKPVQRLWISSLEETAVRRGFENLRDSGEFDNLYQAALCRARADWLVGMNLSRAFTLHYRSVTLHIGRVMTPTLTLLVEREGAITGFQKEKYYAADLNLGGFHAVSQRFPSRTDAERLCAACDGTSAVVRTGKRMAKTEQPPKLYDLTSLQRDANRLLDLTAQQTLDIVQSLYEKRLVTYPRTDSRYLTADMAPRLPDLCERAAEILHNITETVALQGSVLPVGKINRVINDAKVTDHHAIIPTAEIRPSNVVTLSANEKNVLRMIAVRLLCATGEPYQYEETSLTLDCGGASFTAKGRTVTAEGWKPLDRAFRETLRKPMRTERETEDESAAPLPPLAEGQRLQTAGTSIREGVTTPPQRFTDDTLLAAMKNASAEDFARIEDPERTGLGTSATQAGIIEKLVSLKLAERKKKSLVPTELGIALIRILPEEIRSAKLTAEWEDKLKQVERGTLSPAVFLAGIETMTADIIRVLETMPSDLTPTSPLLAKAVPRFTQDRPVVGVCPRCGRRVVEGPKSIYCEGNFEQPPCKFALWKDNRFFTSKGKTITKTAAAKLLKDGRVHMKGLHSAKKGREYDADIIMEDDGNRVSFRLEFDREG